MGESCGTQQFCGNQQFIIFLGRKDHLVQQNQIKLKAHWKSKNKVTIDRRVYYAVNKVYSVGYFCTGDENAVKEHLKII